MSFQCINSHLTPCCLSGICSEINLSFWLQRGLETFCWRSSPWQRERERKRCMLGKQRHPAAWNVLSQRLPLDILLIFYINQESQRQANDTHTQPMSKLPSALGCGYEALKWTIVFSSHSYPSISGGEVGCPIVGFYDHKNHLWRLKRLFLWVIRSNNMFSIKRTAC